MDNGCLEVTEDKKITSRNGKALGRHFHMRCSERIKKSPQKFGPVLGSTREWNSDDAAIIVYMKQDRDYDSNIDMDNIPLLLDDWGA